MSDQLKVTVAFIILCLVWGTTYLGIRVAVEYMPPFFLSGVRHVLAGFIFVVPFVIKQSPFPPLKDFRYIFLAGVLMIVLGNGLVCWSEQYISSGLAALIGAVCPILINLLSIYFFRDTRVNTRTIAGFLLGLAGISILFIDSLKDLLDPRYRLGVILIMAANLAWAFGTISIRKHPIKSNVFLATGLQMIIAGAINILISIIFEKQVSVFEMAPAGIYALLYLILIGSVLGYGSFNYVLRHMPPARASVHGYINTIIAVLLGWLLLDEKLTIGMFLAMIVVLSGVYMVNNDYTRAKK